MGHNHSVHDSDTRFIINPITRQAKCESRKATVIQFDHNSERFTFECPRLIEGHDMSVCNRVEVHYINIDPKTKEQNTGVYVADDLRIDPENPEKVVCSWLISQNATQIIGALNFIVCYKCIENGECVYAWNTAISSVSVSDGINASESVATEYADVLEQWRAELYNAGYINASTMQNEVNTLKSRMDSFVALKDGSTTGDAELIDGRVSFDGYVYSTMGNHIRGVGAKVDEYANNLRIDGYKANNLFSNVKDGCAKIEGYFFRSPDSDMISAGQWNCYTFPVNEGEQYHIKTYTISSGRAVSFMAMAWDADEIDPAISYYPTSASSGETVDIIVTVPSGAVQMLVNENSSVCVALIEKLVGKHYEKADLDYVKSVLSGKTLVCCGDSITEAVNPNGGYFKNYAEIVAERHGMTCHKDGVGGSTMAYGVGKTFSAERYLSVPDFDYLTIWFGWNDAAYSELGTIEDIGNATFYGAYKLVLEHFITNNPTKKIGLIVPYGSESVSPFAQAVREISERYGVPCLDLKSHNRCSLLWGTDNEAQLARRAALTYDGTHPNQDGYNFLSTMYEQFLLTL